MRQGGDRWRAESDRSSDVDRERDWRLLVGGILVLAFLVVLARAAQADDAEHAGALRLRGAAGEVTAPWLDTEVDIRVSGLVARVSVRQRFINDRPEFVEGTYLFPLPERSAVRALRMRVGERVIEGEIREREEARATYEQARADGRRASLVEQARPNVFTASIANLAPYDTIEVELEYVEVLRYADGRFDLRFPMTVAPRYEPQVPGLETSGSMLTSSAPAFGIQADSSADAARLTPAVLRVEDDERALASVHVELDAGIALAGLTSPYHAIDVRRTGTRYTVDLAARKVPMDRDFELEWRPDTASTPRAAVFSETVDGEAYALVMLLPDAARTGPRPPREMIFVIDTSGSMEGMSLDQAKAGLKLALAKLGPRDRFNVIQFDSVTRTLYDLPVDNSDAARTQALAYVDHLRADGGTEMEPALAAAFEDAPPAGYLRQVVFITDGGIANEDALFEQIRSRIGDARLFTVGIGAAPNAYFMRKAAELGRGTFTFIGSADEVGEKMQSLLDRLAAPALTNVSIEWPSTVEAWPARVPDLYAGEPVVVSAKLAALAGSIRVSGELAGAPWSATLPLAPAQPADGIASVWARAKIESLMDAERHGATDARRQIVEVALRHRLASAYTSFVAVDHTPVRDAQQSLARRDVPSLLPARASGGDAIGYPQTATAAPLHALAALALFLVAAGLRRWNGMS
jgi:Ca-activated chloride channel family protein